MSERRSKAESGEGADEQSSQGTRRPSDPLHPSPPAQSYYSQQPSLPQYSQSSTREGISAYASYRARSGAPMPPQHRAPHYQPPGYGPPPLNPRSSAQQVTPDSRQAPIPPEFMSPQSAARSRYEQSPAQSSQPSAKRPRRSGKFLEPERVQVFRVQNLVLLSAHTTWQTFLFRLSVNRTRSPSRANQKFDGCVRPRAQLVYIRVYIMH